MQLINRIFDFYVFGNIHVAIAVFSLVKVTLISNGIENNEVPFFTFFATILGYNFIRLYRRETINSWLIKWLDYNSKFIYAAVIISFIGVIYYGFQLKLSAILSLIPFMLFTFFYAVPFKRKLSSKNSLRALAGMKIFLIAGSWAGVTVLVPAIHHEIEFSKELFIVFVQRLLIVIAITIPFDIRDLEYDADYLRTLPQIVGVVNVKRLGLLLLMFFLGLNFLKNSIDQNYLRIEFVVMIISLVLLVKAKSNQGKYYSAFYVESVPIVWGLLLFLN